MTILKTPIDAKSEAAVIFLDTKTRKGSFKFVEFYLPLRDPHISVHIKCYLTHADSIDFVQILTSYVGVLEVFSYKKSAPNTQNSHGCSYTDSQK